MRRKIKEGRTKEERKKGRKEGRERGGKENEETGGRTDRIVYRFR